MATKPTTEAEDGFLDLAQPDAADVLHLSPTEELILELYDKVLELDVEIALLKAQVTSTEGKCIYLSFTKATDSNPR